MNKKNLLSIGKLSKLMGVSIFSLRYYERIEVLPPAYIDPESNYRYYSFDQIYLLELIMLCVGLDIPLKELKKFINTEDVMDVRAFLASGKKTVINKLNALKRELRFIGTIEKQIDLTMSFRPGQVYTRHVPEKFFYVKPCRGILKDVELFEILQEFAGMAYDEDYYKELLEYGFIAEHSPAGVQYYIFGEVPKPSTGENIKTIPAGMYRCMQNERNQIENVPEVFRGHLKDESFLAIEVNIFAAKHKLSKSLHELRVLEV